MFRLLPLNGCHIKKYLKIKAISEIGHGGPQGSDIEAHRWR
jgi:hypothetical protein